MSMCYIVGPVSWVQSNLYHVSRLSIAHEALANWGSWYTYVFWTKVLSFAVLNLPNLEVFCSDNDEVA